MSTITDLSDQQTPIIVHFPTGHQMSFPDEAAAQQHAPSIWEILKNQAGNFAGSVSSAIGGPEHLAGSGTMTAQALGHPLDTLKTLGRGVVDIPRQQEVILDKAKQAWDQGDYPGAAAHLINYALPIVGTANEKAAQQLKSNDYAGALGTALGSAAPIVAGGESPIEAGDLQALRGESGEMVIPGTGAGTATAPAREVAGTAEGAARDTAFFQQAKAENPSGSLSDWAKRAQGLKDTVGQRKTAPTTVEDVKTKLMKSPFLTDAERADIKAARNIDPETANLYQKLLDRAEEMAKKYRKEPGSLAGQRGMSEQDVAFEKAFGK